jgi:AraC-like DNA-binding protein
MKPDFEHYTRHINNQPDVCTVLDFTPDFYESIKEHYRDEAGWFFNNKDLHALILKCSAEVDYLHHMILRTKSSSAGHLRIDEWVMRLVDKVLTALGNVLEVKPVPDNLKKLHLATVEKAKNFILANYDKDISLQQLSDHCCVSLFHFSRLFRAIMKMSPHQYLSEIRLNHARILLETSKKVDN